MSVSHYEAVDELLLLLAEARERAEQAARHVRRDGGQPHVAEALEEVDRELLVLHRRLLDETYFPSSSPPAKQLALDAA